MDVAEVINSQVGTQDFRLEDLELEVVQVIDESGTQDCNVRNIYSIYDINFWAWSWDAAAWFTANDV